MSSGVGPDTSGDSSAAPVSLVEVLEITTSSLAVIDRWADELPIDDHLAVVNTIRAHCDARESLLLAARLESGASQRSVERLLQKGDKTSKRTAKKRTKRAKAVNKNRTIADKLKTGELSPDQADVIADAADKTDGAAAEDEELVEELASTPPDQGRKIADEWVREHTDNDDVQDRHDRQRRLRNVRRWSTDRGTDVLALEGDTVSLDRVELAIRNRSDDLYRADGGRDLPAGQHPRSREQRNYDAAVDLLTGTTGASGGGVDGEGGASKPKKTKTKAQAKPGPRSTIVVTMTLDQALGLDLSPVRQVGGGLVPPSILAELLCDADLVGLVNDRHGLPLWMGRTTRYFTKEQVLALIARDGGCAVCRAHYSRCQAHHIIPWEAPARGPTDIDNGVMVCTDCHHWLHEHDLILVRDPDTGTWSTRPAQPHERAPKRRPAQPPEPEQGNNRRGRSERGRPQPHERPRTGALF